jgi:SET domain-containing protein
VCFTFHAFHTIDYYCQSCIKYCFLYFACYFSIDASDNNEMGRYINDASRTQANCVPKASLVNHVPAVMFFASKDICVGTEIRYDYGVPGLPWRQVSRKAAIYLKN